MQNNLFFELFPLMIFFVVYYLSKNIFLATGICMIISWAQLILCRLKYKKISRNLWISTILITIFGGLTIALHNKTFIMIKPTILYWIIAGTLIIGQILGKNFIKSALQKEFHLPDSLWSKLNIAWAIFFIAVGFLSLYVALNFSEYNWVKFKVFGMISFMFAFGIVSSIFVYFAQKTKKVNK